MDTLEQKSLNLPGEKNSRKQLIGYVPAPGALFLAAIFSVVYQGFNYGSNNNALQIPILQRASNPGLYPGDPYVATLDDYFSLFWWLLSRLPGVADWPAVFLGLHIATRWLTLLACFVLLRVLASHPGAALLSTALLGISASLAGGSAVGSSELFMDYFNHSHIAGFLVLFAFAASLRERHYWGAVLAGLAFDINAFMGAWALFSLLALMVSTGRPRRISDSFAAALLFLLAASPALGWILSSTSAGSGNYPSFDYRDYLREYFPNHFLIDQASLHNILKLCLISLCGASAIYLLPHRSRQMGVIFASLITLFLIGAALPLLTSLPILLNLHLLRVDGFITFLSAIAVAGVSMDKLCKPSKQPETCFSAVATLMGLAFGNWSITAAGLALSVHEKTRAQKRLELLPAGLLMASALFSARETALPVPAGSAEITAATAYLVATGSLYFAFPLRPIGAFILPGIAGFAATGWAAALTGLALLALVPGVLPESRHRGPLQAAAVGAVIAADILGLLVANGRVGHLFFVAALALEIIRRHRPSQLRGQGMPAPAAARKATAILAAFLAMMTIPVVAGRVYRKDIENPVAWLPAESWREVQSAWRDVQVWANRNTPVDAVFLIPFHHVDIGFGVFSERSIWIDWKQGGAVPWAPAYYWVWKARTEAQFRADDPRAFGRENRVSYAVVPKRNAASVLPRVDGNTWAALPVAYRNREFIVYDLRD